jgi:hypothetical protein
MFMTEELQSVTFQRGLHRSLHQSCKQLQRFRVLSKSRRKSCKSFGMPSQALQGNPFSIVALEKDEMD